MIFAFATLKMSALTLVGRSMNDRLKSSASCMNEVGEAWHTVAAAAMLAVGEKILLRDHEGERHWKEPAPDAELFKVELVLICMC